MDETNSVTVTLRGGPGPDAPWVIIRASDTTDARRILEDTGELIPMLEAAQRANRYFTTAR